LGQASGALAALTGRLLRARGVIRCQDTKEAEQTKEQDAF
jgi:hypothetical protein